MPEFIVSPFGARFRSDFYAIPRVRGPGFRGLNSADCFEWKALLAAIDESVGHFRMIDLGAGYGWWGINAAAALDAQNRGRRATIAMVEGEPTHHEWLSLAAADNPFPGIRYRPIHAAIGTQRGSDWFYIGRAGSWYGQRLIMEYHRALLDSGAPDVSARGNGLDTSDNYSLKRIPTLVLRDLLPWFGSIDFVDMDIQGTELELIRAERGLLAKRIKRLFVSTHSLEIDDAIRGVLGADWDLRFGFQPGRQQTDAGWMDFEDGQQFWTRVP
jgi:FkbM family methyltransferase